MIRVTAIEAVRHIAIGAVIVAGLGGIAAPALTHWLDLPPGTISGRDLGAGGSLAYLSGSLGAALFEAVLMFTGIGLGLGMVPSSAAASDLSAHYGIGPGRIPSILTPTTRRGTARAM